MARESTSAESFDTAESASALTAFISFSRVGHGRTSTVTSNALGGSPPKRMRWITAIASASAISQTEALPWFVVTGLTSRPVLRRSCRGPRFSAQPRSQAGEGSPERAGANDSRGKTAHLRSFRVHPLLVMHPCSTSVYRSKPLIAASFPLETADDCSLHSTPGASSFAGTPTLSDGTLRRHRPAYAARGRWRKGRMSVGGQPVISE